MRRLATLAIVLVLLAALGGCGHTGPSAAERANAQEDERSLQQRERATPADQTKYGVYAALKEILEKSPSGELVEAESGNYELIQREAEHRKKEREEVCEEWMTPRQRAAMAKVAERYSDTCWEGWEILSSKEHDTTHQDLLTASIGRGTVAVSGERATWIYEGRPFHMLYEGGHWRLDEPSTQTTETTPTTSTESTQTSGSSRGTATTPGTSTQSMPPRSSPLILVGFISQSEGAARHLFEFPPDEPEPPNTLSAYGYSKRELVDLKWSGWGTALATGTGDERICTGTVCKRQNRRIGPATVLLAGLVDGTCYFKAKPPPMPARFYTDVQFELPPGEPSSTAALKATCE